MNIKLICMKKYFHLIYPLILAVKFYIELNTVTEIHGLLK